MYTFMFELHSGMRWLVVLAAVVALAWYAWLWIRGRGLGAKGRLPMAVFSVLLDIQVTIGIVFLVWNGLAGVGFPPHRLEHGVVMLLALAIVHLPIAWKKKPALNVPRNYVMVIVLVLGLIVAGVMRLPQGWVM